MVGAVFAAYYLGFVLPDKEWPVRPAYAITNLAIVVICGVSLWWFHRDPNSKGVNILRGCGLALSGVSLVLALVLLQPNVLQASTGVTAIFGGFLVALFVLLYRYWRVRMDTVAADETPTEPAVLNGWSAFLIPPTTVTAKGDGQVIPLPPRNLLLTLEITEIIEQQSIDVSIWGSADSVTWDDEPFLAFPQKFYQGQHPLLLDLSKHPEIKFLRAHWEVGRWGHQAEGPRFELQLSVKEVPPNILEEAQRLAALAQGAGGK